MIEESGPIIDSRIADLQIVTNDIEEKLETELTDRAEEAIVESVSVIKKESADLALEAEEKLLESTNAAKRPEDKEEAAIEALSNLAGELFDLEDK